MDKLTKISNKQVEDFINTTFKKLDVKVDNVKKSLDVSDKQIELVDKTISFHIDAEKEIQFLDIEELGDVLHSFIFDQHTSLEDMIQPEIITGIIESSLVTDNEDKIRDEVFVSVITRWLKYHVIPYIYENMKNIGESDNKGFDINLFKYSDEIAEERDHGGLLEHRHKSHMYWHPVTRVHKSSVFPYITPKNELPQGHITTTDVITPKDVIKSDEDKFYEDNIYFKKIRHVVAKEATTKESNYFDFLRLSKSIYDLLIKKSLTVYDVQNNPVHIDYILNYSLFSGIIFTPEDRKEVVEWVRKKLLPAVNSGFVDILKETSESSKLDESLKHEYMKLIKNSVSELHVVKNIYYFKLDKLTEQLYEYIIVRDYPIEKLLSKNLFMDIMNPCIDHLNKPSEDILYELKKDVYTWLVNRTIPDIYMDLHELEDSSKEKFDEKAADKAVSEIFSKSVKDEFEIISINEIINCVYPVNHDYITDEDFEYISGDTFINIIYSYTLLQGKYISEYYILRKIEEKIDNDIPKLSKQKILVWLREFIIPCLLNKIQDKEKQKEVQIPEIKKLDYTVDVNSKLYKRMNKIVRDFYDSFYDESSLCLYYTYYVLNLKGNTDFDFEFRELENKLYNDFYNYGIFAVLGEIKHFVDMFYFRDLDDRSSLENFITHDSNHRIVFRKDIDEFIVNISKCIGIDKKSIYRIIQIYEIKNKKRLASNKKYSSDNKEVDIEECIEFLYLIEKHFGYYTRPDFIFKLANKVFGVKDKSCYWSEQYGGKKWESISKTMLARKNMVSKTVFIDTCWSLQHNTQLFINKVFDKESDIYILKKYLTDVKNGRFDRVYKCAVKYNPKLNRFKYRSLILQSDEEIENFENGSELVRIRRGKTEREIVRKDDRIIVNDIKRSLRLHHIRDEESINHSLYYLNNEDKYVIYKEITELYGKKELKIYQLNRKTDEFKTLVKIVTPNATFTTDLGSILAYFDDNYPGTWEIIFKGMKEKKLKGIAELLYNT